MIFTHGFIIYIYIFFFCRIACISCPTLFSKILQIKSPEHHVVLLEYDTRFQVHGKNFVHYDYKQPRELPATLAEGSFDVVIADPPFLSEECLSKMAQTIKFLSKDKVILCTGMPYIKSSCAQVCLR